MRYIALVVALIVAVSTAAYAQQAMPASQQKTIFDFQKEIGMNDKQVADLKKIADDLQKTMAAKATEAQALRQELGVSINSKADIKVIRKTLEKIAAIQVDSTCLDIETSRSVEKVLTPDQQAKWQDIQKKAIEEARAAMQQVRAQVQAEQAAPAPTKK